MKMGLREISMGKLSRRSLRNKLSIVIILAILFSGMGITASLVYLQYQSLKQQMTIDGLNIAKIAAKNLENIAIMNGANNSAAVQKGIDEIGNSTGMKYALIIDKDLIDIYDTEKKDIGRNLSDDPGTVKSVENREANTSIWIDDNGEKALDAQIPVDFKVGDKQISSVDIGISMNNLDKGLFKSIISSSILSVLFVVVFSLIPYIFIGKFVIKPLKEGVKLAKAIADKDLTMDINVKSNDEIGEIITSIQIARNNLKTVIEEAQKSAEQVASASEVLALSLEDITEEIQDSTVFVENMSTSMESNILIVKETNTAMEDVTENTKKTEMASLEANSYIKRVEDSALIGKGSIDEIVDTIDNIANSSKKVSEVIMELEEETVKIENIVSVVSQIAEQTNLLALNAAIEAARAGEYGRGFAVVAEEVKKLAEQSSESLSGIIQLTKNIQRKTRNVVEMVTLTTEKVNLCVNQSTVTCLNINKIIENVESAVTNISKIAGANTVQLTSVVKVKTLMSKITTSAKNGAVESQEMSASIEQQMSAFEELNTTSHELQNMSINLRRIIKQFKL